MLPIEKLEKLVHRSEELDQLLCEPNTLASPKRASELNREKMQLASVLEAYDAWKVAARRLEEDRAVLDDPELGALAAEELPAIEAEVSRLEREVQLRLLPQDPNDGRPTILEIRAGTGGEEAALFAADLFRMYTRYAERKGWRVELATRSEAAAGGIKELIATVTGSGVFGRLKHESGVHRVQRVPETEAQGRIHTSTATVVVLPEADEVELELEEKDLRFDIAAASGPGGQGVNTTNSAVQVTHLPTGLSVRCMEERSQHKNKAKALSLLRSRLLEAERERARLAEEGERRGMVGGGERSEKIRTYNFPQNRLTDHRIGLTLYKLDRVVDGELDELIDPMIAHVRASQLEAQHRGGDGP